MIKQLLRSFHQTFSDLRNGSARQKGQALVVLLLILVVTLTVGLSVVSRTVTNIQESSTTERSTKAFEAAEAGIESTLRQNIPSLIPNGQTSQNLTAISVGGATSNITVTKSNSGTNSYYQPVKPVAQDDDIQLDINPADCSGCTAATSLNLSWSLLGSTEDPSGCSLPNVPAALEISIITYDSTAATPYGVTRYNYNANACGALSADGFASAGTDTTNSPAVFASEVNVPLPKNGSGTLIGQIMRIRPLYNSATIRVAPATSGQQIPVQSYIIRSAGVSGDTERVVQVERSIGGLPSIFDYVLFNGSATQPLTKN